MITFSRLSTDYLNLFLVSHLLHLLLFCSDLLPTPSPMSASLSTFSSSLSLTCILDPGTSGMLYGPTAAAPENLFKSANSWAPPHSY